VKWAVLGERVEVLELLKVRDGLSNTTAEPLPEDHYRAAGCGLSVTGVTWARLQVDEQRLTREQVASRSHSFAQNANERGTLPPITGTWGTGLLAAFSLGLLVTRFVWLTTQMRRKYWVFSFPQPLARQNPRLVEVEPLRYPRHYHQGYRHPFVPLLRRVHANIVLALSVHVRELLLSWR
jgi:hypothetical protein